MAKRVITTILLMSLIVGTIGYINWTSPDLYSGVLVVKTDRGQGSCFVVALKDGWWYAITAAHVVETETAFYMRPDAEPFLIIDKEEYKAEIVKIDLEDDVALIRFLSPENYKIYKFAQAQIGEQCVALGWSRGAFLRYPGSVVSLNFNDFIVANGGVVPGCSGGPLLNEDDEVIGITVAIALYRGWAFDNTALYVPSRYARGLIVAVLGE